MSEATIAALLVLAAFLTALAALVGFAIFYRGRDKRLETRASDKNSIVFLFDGGYLTDATEAAGQILASVATPGDDWGRLVSVLGPRFDGFETVPDDALELGPLVLNSTDGTSRLRAEFVNGILRLELADAESFEPAADIDRFSLAALRDELATHRAIAGNVPFLIWRENRQGQITWANRAYLDHAEIVQTNGAVAPWPPARLFEVAGVAPGDPAPAPVRAVLDIGEEGSDNWFELHRVGLGPDLGDETLFAATPIQDLVRAEASLSEFINTLTGTFAHLPIGLAIFDRERKLSLFNPALTDLTMLPADFLCAQPTLYAFLDRLRDKRMMPEPKDYKGWRQAMSELEAKAVDGTYLETWFLPTGQTYRVTGQPHPGGALALLFEDISSEMSLTHKFRAELEISQAVLDGIDDAVAVFTAGGVLSMTNDAFVDLWETDPSTTLSTITVSDATFVWGRKCNPTPVWRQLRGFIAEGGERQKWEAPVTLKDGRVLNCRFRPLVQGATMVTFSPAPATIHPGRDLAALQAQAAT